MSKRNIIIISLVFLTILGGLGIWLSNKYTGGGAKEVSRFSFFGTQDEEAGGLSGGKGGNGSAEEAGGEAPDKPSLPELRKISPSPTAGIYPFEKSVKGDDGKKLTRTFLRRVDRTTGNVFDTRMDTMEETRVTNTTIPKIYEAVWAGNENSPILRYLRDDGETIETFLSKITEGVDGKDGGLTGTFLPQDIKSLALSPKKDRFFYLSVSSGEAQGTVVNLDGKKSTVFRYPFTEWLTNWPSENVITLATKPSGKTPGFVYSITPSGGNLTKIIGGINGLTALMSPDGKKMIYSESAGGSFSLGLYDLGSAETTAQSAKTLPEKCVWSGDNDVFYCAIPLNPPAALYPDSWYQGVVSFNDVLARVDVKNGSMTVLVDPEQFVGEKIDAINLVLSKNEDYLFFINKKDLTSWVLEMGI